MQIIFLAHLVKGRVDADASGKTLGIIHEISQICDHEYRIVNVDRGSNLFPVTLDHRSRCWSGKRKAALSESGKRAERSGRSAGFFLYVLKELL